MQFTKNTDKSFLRPCHALNNPHFLSSTWQAEHYAMLLNKPEPKYAQKFFEWSHLDFIFVYGNCWNFDSQKSKCLHLYPLLCVEGQSPLFLSTFQWSESFCLWKSIVHASMRAKEGHSAKNLFLSFQSPSHCTLVPESCQNAFCVNEDMSQDGFWDRSRVRD